jgi:DNA repair exonuclease SbcCD ATPase subunit
MRSLKFHYVRAENILCFGPEGIQIHFKDYGNVVQVIGLNLDHPGSDDEPASNAAGKSSLQELLSIGLYGRTVKSPTKNKGGQIVNVLAEKGVLEVQWDDFRVLRTFKKSKTGTVTCKLQLWKSPHHIWDDKTEITQTSDLTQNEIEKQLGLTHHAFCNVVIFDDSNTYSFLEADLPTKRQVVENLLDLDQYRGYHDNCKEIVKELKRKTETLTHEYEHLQSEVDSAARRVTTVIEQQTAWKAQKKRAILELQDVITAKQKRLESSDTGEALSNWQKTQDRIVLLTDEITDYEAKRLKVEQALVVAREKLENARNERFGINETMQQYQLILKEAQSELDKSLKLVGSLESFEDGATCPYCYGTINRQNYGTVLINTRHTAEKCRNNIAATTEAIGGEQEKYTKKSSAIQMMQDKIAEAEAKVGVFEGKIRKNRKEITELSQLPKPEGTTTEQVLEVEIVELKKQLKSKNEEHDGQSPYMEIIAQAEKEKTQKEKERDDKGKELQDTEAELPYYQFWQEAFGDNGIRKFVIDGIIPALNSRIAYWLQILIDGKIELTFNNKLEETITRSGNPASYHNMSNGERRRVNLAVSQAFSYVMMLNSGTCPSIVFLDEITGGGIDRAGIPGVYNMIFELAKERQVFVTTHNESLMNLLHGCESIRLKKQNDITVLLS